MSDGPITLRLLGGIELCGPDGRPARAVLAQPSRLALLLFLAATSSSRTHRKDTVRGLFWPEADSRHAHQALNRAVYFLRQALGADVVVTRGDDEVGVADEKLRCDVILFERALDAGSLEAALELYRGDLAPGFLVAGLPDFERWMAAERNRLRERAVQAAMALADRDEARGRLELAESWARRAEVLSPYDERVAARRIILLDRMGDRAAALRSFGALERRLSSDLEVTPSPETLALIAAVRARHESRHAFDRREPGLAQEPATVGPPPSPTAPPARPAGLRRQVLAGAFVAVAAVSWSIFFRPRPLTLTTTNAAPITSEPGIEFQPALSPDGRLIAFAVLTDRREFIEVRSAAGTVGGSKIRLATNESEDQALPSWSTDGELVRFVTTPNPGVRPSSFSRASNARSFGWREVPRLGGEERTVPLPRQTRWTAWSPDGARAAFTAGDSIFIYDMAGHRARLVAVHPGAWDPHSLAWSPDGRWIAYVNGNPFWPERWNTAPSQVWLVHPESGRRVPVTDDDHLNVSPVWLDAHHLLFVSDRDGPREIYAVEIGGSGPQGDPVKVPGGTDAHSISLSADGRRLAVARLLARQNVKSYPLDVARPLLAHEGEPVTTGSQVVETHDVAPDGEWLAYDSNIKGNADIYTLRLRGGSPIPLVAGPETVFSPRWSPDGDEIAYYGGAGSDIWVVPAEGGVPTRLTDAPGIEELPIWAPDGLSLAYRSRYAGRPEAWIVTRERIGGPWSAPRRLTDFGCPFQAWAHDGSGVLCGWSDSTLLTLVSPSGEILRRQDLATAGLTQLGPPALSPDGRTLFLRAARGGETGIWALPLSGSGARLVVSFEEPSALVQSYPGTINVTRDRLYLTVGEFESDIWAMDLVRK